MRDLRWPWAMLATLCFSCTPSEKAPPPSETAGTTTETPPVIETLKAPTAAVDIAWEEWSPVGVAEAKLDWPAGAARAGGALYLAGTRKLGSTGGGPDNRAEIAFVKITPSGAEEVASYASDFGERASAALAAGPDSRLWFVGGMYTPPPLNLAPEGRLEYAALETPVGEVYTWEPGGRDLQLVTHLPVPRGKAAAFFHGGELYVVGGTYDPSNPTDANNRQVHRFSVREGLWTKLHETRVPLAQPATAVARDGLYVIGGKQLKPAYVTNAVYRYDLTVFKWQKLAPLPAPRFGARGYVVGGYIYVVGGCEAEALGTPGRMGRRTYRFDLEGKTWEELPSPLPEGCTLTAYDGSFFYLIGSNKTYRGRLVKRKTGPPPK